MPGTPFLTDKPEPNDILSNSQHDIQNNTEYFQQALNRDHQITFGALVNDSGLHRKVSLASQGMADPPMLPGAQSMIFTSSNNIWVKNAAAIADPVQMTNNNAGPPNVVTNGFTWLPGGLLLQWGIKTGVASGGGTAVSFVPVFSAPPFSVVITQIYGGTSLNQNNNMIISVNPNAVAADGFRVQTSNSASSTATQNGFYWMAIGTK